MRDNILIFSPKVSPRKKPVLRAWRDRLKPGDPVADDLLRMEAETARELRLLEILTVRAICRSGNAAAPS